MSVRTAPAFVTLAELQPGQRFLFAAADLEERGPCTLIEKRIGSATIEYAPHVVTQRFRARDRHGQVIERAITQTVSGRSSCALSAQVIPIGPAGGTP